MTPATAIPILLGIALHQLFRIHEPKPTLRTAAGILLVPILSWLARCSRSSHWETPSTDFALCYASSLTSLVFYRLSPVHPLAKFPGPLIFRLTKLTTIWTTSRGHHHQVLRKLHEQYGPVVRVGPNEVSVCDVSAVKSVLGTEGLPKGIYYDARYNPKGERIFSLLTLRGEEHSQRRRRWDHGMSSESLASYAEIISQRATQLVQELEKSDGPIDIAAWISYFSFDFMGDMAFGGGFEMLRDHGDKHGHWNALEGFMYMMSLVSHVPWFTKLVVYLPVTSTCLGRFRMFAEKVATKRIKSGARMKDLWFYLTDEAELESRKPTIPEVVADAGLAIIAGADTVATVMSSLFYLLLVHPEAMNQVQKEIDSVFPQGSNALDTRMHNRLVYLDACLKEGMRLYPPVPTNGPRRVPLGSKGKVIAGRFIPEQTEVYLSPYCLHRNPAYFDQPDKFIPERWLGEIASTTAEAYIPFSRGPANCVGRNLARQEMLMVCSLLLQTFEFKIANTEDFANDAWERSLKDYFVMSRGKLRVHISKRANS